MASATKAAQEAAKKAALQAAIRAAAANRARAGGAQPTIPGGLSTNGSTAMKGVLPVGAAPPAPDPPVRPPFQYVPDAGYNDDVALNKKRFDDTSGNLDKTETTTKFDYGFDDVTNPFSRSTELKRQWLAKGGADQVNLNSMGMSLSGANLRALDRNKRGQDKDTASLRAAYDAALEVIRRGRVQASTDKEAADLAAGQNSFNRQLAIYNGS